MGIPNLTICYGGELKEEISLHCTSLREISYICAMETVNTSENIKEVVFNGVKYRLMGKKRYYLASYSANKDRIGAKGLHTAIWEYFNNREVPKGYCIHHIDGNPFNNDISNLQCMEIGEHRKLHAEKNNKNEDYVRQRNETLKRAQEELKKAHQKYQNYLQNKYKGMDTRKTADIDLIKQGLALQRYQKSSQNPYLDQQVLKMKKENTSSFQENGNFQIPPRPKAFQRSEYIQRPKTTVQLKKPVNSNVSKNQTNMKFLESVTKIYEQSGRGDLANELKNSIIKAKQSI